MSCELEKYKILYQAYADEIRNLWQRSIFLATFMTLAWGGYGALQLKILDKSCETHAHYHLISLGLCVVIIILSLLWVAMAKGSKFVQEAHEEKIKQFVRDKSLQVLYCNLNDYKGKDLDGKSENLIFSGALRAFRYSPSKINIALGWISATVAGVLIITHIFSLFLLLVNLQCNPLILLSIAIIFILIEIASIAFFMKDYLKGGK